MHDGNDPDDATLLAELDISDARADAWSQLLTVADEFQARPSGEADCRWTNSERMADGATRIGHPMYAERVQRACRVLSEVGAVTPAYHWMKKRPPRLPSDGSMLSPGDAVRLATTIVRGERFGDGIIGQALENGTLQAVLASLAAWYRGQ